MADDKCSDMFSLSIERICLDMLCTTFGARSMEYACILYHVSVAEVGAIQKTGIAFVLK